MIIAIDLDDILAESLKSFIDFHNKNYKTKLKTGDFKSFYLQEIIYIDRKEELKRVRLFDDSRHFDEIPPLEGAREVVKELSKKNKLVIVTSRPQKQEKRTREWTLKYFPEIKEIFFIRKDYHRHSKTKAEVCKEIGASFLIEDKLDYAEECAKQGIKVLLLDYPWNRKNNLSRLITRVSSWKDIREKIETSK